MSDIKDINGAVEVVENIFRDVDNSKNILFGNDMAKVFSKGYTNFKPQYDKFKKGLTEQLNGNKEKLEKAGLLEDTGQLALKLETFELAHNEYKKKGGIYLLDKVLEVASIILGSLGNAIPEIGSFIQEFIDIVRYYLSRQLD